MLYFIDSWGTLGYVYNVFVDLYLRKQRTLEDEANTTI